MTAYINTDQLVASWDMFSSADWSFVEKTSVMQDPNPKCVQNFR